MAPPSTFASAAAGTNHNHNAARDSAADWSRRTNGATQTFRRPSGATTTPTSAQQNDMLAQHPARYVPPHRNGTVSDTRYAKEQLLDLYRSQASSDGALEEGLSALYVGGWLSDTANGLSSGWGRSEHTRDAQPGPDICWLKDGPVEPMALLDMDDDEKELFSTSVNTPIKLPVNSNKDGPSANGMPGRRISVSASATTPGGIGLPSPGLTRGSGRRRETSESYPFPPNPLGTPSATGFNKDDHRTASPPPSLIRRRTEKMEDKDSDEKAASSPFGTLKRHPTGPLAAGFGAPSSPWNSGQQSAGLPPMGSFGNFGLGANPGQQGAISDKRPGLSSGRSESRFKNLLSKDGSEDIASRTLERKTSVSSLSRVDENESWRPQDRTEHANDPLVETEEDLPIGSAALAADTDVSPPHARQPYRPFGTPSRQSTQDDFGFGAFGMTSDNAHGFGQGFLQGRDAFQHTPGPQRLGHGTGGASHEPMSPTDTNPYQSPEQHGVDRGNDDTDPDSDLHNAHLPGLGGFGSDGTPQLGGLGGLGGLPHLGRNMGAQGPASDRSQTSSVGATRVFPGLGGFGALGAIPGPAAWPVSQGGLGTPGRQSAGLSNPFSNGLFPPVSDLQPSGLAGLGSGGNASAPTNTFGSRMASMFPSSIPEPVRPEDRDQSQSAKPQHESSTDPGHIGLMGPTAQPPIGQEPATQPQTQPPPPSSSASNQPPAHQQRQMVMPDRMRWIYRDPQGQTQGPWSGLEMHDWYKAGFFSPELLVKKFEDPDYEPLAQLIRRIGNSREPFLVPQIGIPHGEPSTNGPNAWAGSGAVTGNVNAAGAQPPFASSFPSFGTTLTADQQNALERRKQEEQYLMARQKEHLAQAQIAQRMQMHGGHTTLMPGQLHHHSSAHSLQSQPSFGSITSPNTFQPSPIQGPSNNMASTLTPGFFENNAFRTPGGLGAVGAGVDSLGHIREEEIPGIMNRLNIGDGRSGHNQFGAPGQPFTGQQSGHHAHEQQVQHMLNDRARLQQEQAEHDGQQSASEESSPNDRLQQFQQLQGQTPVAEGLLQQRGPALQGDVKRNLPQQRQTPEPLSLTEQVQKAASAKHSPAPQQPGLPHPFPPAPSQSPLPAPAAQRTGRQSVADQLQTESRDRSQTPSVDTPSAAIAPWAKETSEPAKGPSLKEIQEAEAKKAAEAEALAVAARRAAFEREMEAQAAAVLPQPGLPAGSNWATMGSPATPTGATPAAWAKATVKVSGPAAAKSMAQIQKEEEARKKKLAAAAAIAQANVMGVVAHPAGGKSYANLAGKVSTPAGPAANPGGSGAWTTVGASGKTKTPAAAVSAGPRTVSGSVVPTLPTVSAVRKPPTRSSTMTNSATVNAQEEFRKWAVNELKPDLNKGINADDFVASLVFLPPDSDIITEAVHGVSSTIDSRHFAEEFIRKKKLADKGVVDASHPPKSTSPASQAAAGWSEVAKKGPSKEPAREEANGNFRVVAAKKKGGKR